MPYVTCNRCARATYAARSHSMRALCPHCDAPLPMGDATASADAVERAVDKRIERALDLAREELDMDVAMLTEVVEDEEIARHASGRWGSIETLVGSPLPLEDTFCARMLEGRISGFVADADNDERVSDVRARTMFGVGAYIGVPLTPDQGRLYVLCCLASEARPALSEADVSFLRGLGESLLEDLQESQA